MLKNIKPKIKISDFFCMNDSDPYNVVYQVKFVNFTKKVITKLDYFLECMTLSEDLIHDIEEIPAACSKLQIIDKYDKKDVDAKYAARISYKIPKSKIEEIKNNDNQKLIFTIVAEDPDSGTTACIKQVFEAKYIVSGKH